MTSQPQCGGLGLTAKIMYKKLASMIVTIRNQVTAKNQLAMQQTQLLIPR